LRGCDENFQLNFFQMYRKNYWIDWRCVPLRGVAIIHVVW